MTNVARFTIEGTASSPGGYDATAGQTLHYALEGGPAGVVQTWTLQVYDPADLTSPLASPSAPLMTLVGATSGQKVNASTPSSQITSVVPAGMSSWIVRSLVNGGKNAKGKDDPDYVFERMVVVKDISGRRKMIATEETQYGPDGWAGAVNDHMAAQPTGLAAGTRYGQKGEWNGTTYVPMDGWITVYADPTGATSAVSALLLALSRAQYGQCVYLPKGRYLIDHLAHIVIPSGVTLCGEDRAHNAGPFGSSGTAALGHMGSQLYVTGTPDLLAPTDQCGIRHLEFYYPNQNGASAEPGHGTFGGAPVEYGWTIETAGANVTVENCTPINSLDFMKAASAVTVSDINGWPLRTGIYLARCADAVTINKVRFNRSSMVPYYDAALLTWVLANCSAFIVDGAEQFAFTDCFAFSVAKGLVFKDVDLDGFAGCRGSFKGHGFDSSGVACILIDQPNGLNLQGLQLSDCFLSCAAAPILFQDTAVKTDNGRPAIDASNVEFGGTMVNAVKLATGSYGRYKQTLGSVYSNSGPAFYAQSATSSSRTWGVEVNNGVGRRTGGAGDIEDIYYGSAP